MSGRLGLRREVLILLPVALLLLVVLSTFTLFSYRSALGLLVEERQEEAARLAAGVAGRLRDQGRFGVATAAELQALAPQARSVAVMDEEGNALVASGDLPDGGLRAPDGLDLRKPVGAGPGDALPDGVAGFAPLEPRRWVRVELPAGVLAGQRRALTVLSVVVLGLNAALLLLVFSFLRHLMTPWETLLERARQMGAEQEAGEGEVEFLVSTFERAMVSLTGDSRRAEDDIAALERTLSSSLQSGLLLLDRAGRVLALNPVAAGLLGIEPPPSGTPLADALAGQPELRDLLASAVAEQTAPRREECAIRAGGEARTVGLTVHPLRRDDGGVRGWLVLFADLTEVRRRAEESRIADSLARLGEMAGGVAHELRNSLATLRGYLTLIERRPDEESIADYLAEIRREADHLERVLQDFLSFARPGTARLEEVDLAELARRAAADPALAGGPPVRVRVAPAAEGVRLRGDSQLLERAVRNLLHNSLQASVRAEPVDLSIDLVDDGVELAVEDRGPGLSAEMRERLFHPFATGRRGGVGLGLALAHRIMTLHGGRIRLEDRPGGGTRALLFFPRDGGQPEGTARAAASR